MGGRDAGGVGGLLRLFCCWKTEQKNTNEPGSIKSNKLFKKNTGSDHCFSDVLCK